MNGDEIREKFKQELKEELKEREDLTKHNIERDSSNYSSNPLNLEHIKESGLLVEIDEVNKKRFSLLELSLDDKKYLAHASFISLTVQNVIPLKLINIKNQSAHVLINANENSSLDIVFLAEGNNSIFIEAHLEKSANIRVFILSKSGSIQTRFYSKCQDNSRFESLNFSLATLESKSSVILLDGASLLTANSYFNKNSSSKSNDVVIHRGKNTNSLITSKGYLIDSFSDFRGLIKIEPSAFDSQGFQESAVLLEGKSKSISIPDLEILNNEVKCSHGSTISRIKDEDLFYFESRGISKSVARLMLVEGHLLSIFPDAPKVKDLAISMLNELAENMLAGDAL
ncbi:MAG: SufB/SufD family protein [Candidatus Woesearchaeota archaeon]